MKPYSIFNFSLLFLGFLFIQESKAQYLFPKKDLMPLGAYYYPEHWPKEDWKRDFQNMRKMGLEFTHFAEFAWAFLEPTEGTYNFGWLDTAVQWAGEAGLKVILCTPTPTPPVWLSENHPDILAWNGFYQPYKHGGRQHISWSSETYKKYVNKIVTELGKRYGNNPYVWGWQLDNEPSHYGKTDFSPNNKAKFQDWCKKKYGTIDNLNRDWGTAFWSLKYNHFGQIELPNPLDNSNGNPHLELDFKRFDAANCAEFLNFQAEILRNLISPKQWITTNYMGTYIKNDFWLTAKHLDLNTITSYPVRGGTGTVGQEDFRRSDGYELAHIHDFSRSVNGQTAIMELQPGQVNWAWYNPLLSPGTIRLWLWHAFAADNKFTCTYRYRQPNFNSEQYHDGLVGLDGITPSKGGLEYQTVAKEMQQLKKQLPKNPTPPLSYAGQQAVFLWDYTNIWQMEEQPQTQNWNWRNHLNKYVIATKQLGIQTSYSYQNQTLNKYPVAIANSYQNISIQEVEEWTKYVENGGHLILTARSGHKDKRGHLWETLHAEPIWKLIGAKIDFFDHMPAKQTGAIQFGEKTFEWISWADVLSPDSQTETWAKYGSNFYAGKSCVTHRKLGKGTVTYIGTESTSGEMELLVLQQIYQRYLNYNRALLPKSVFYYWRDGFHIYLNYSNYPYTPELPKKAKILVGNANIAPGDVLVWK